MMPSFPQHRNMKTKPPAAAASSGQSAGLNPEPASSNDASMLPAISDLVRFIMKKK